MSKPKINIVEANSFKEAYDVAPEEFKEQIEEHAADYYTDKIGKLIASFNLKDVTFIVNAIRCVLVSLECFSPEDFQLAHQLLPEEALQVMKYAAREDRKHETE